MIMPYSATMGVRMKIQPQSLDDWLAHCERLHPKNIDMGLARVKAVADRMGLQFGCPVLTVAGTNGKGSTCAMLESILRQAGYRTGVYTSPHLVHFEERLRLCGEVVEAADLVASFAAVEEARSRTDPGISLTYFEFSTLAFFEVMTRSDLDVVILEVGLGGRLDATNIIDPDCAVITSIDLDHMEFLGPDRESIGFEKAGIMRTGRPVVVGDPMPPQSLLDHATEIDADIWRFGVDFKLSPDQRQWGWSGRGRGYSGLPYPALPGAHQLVNAAGVLAALAALRERLPVSVQAVRSGLAAVQLAGRFQVIVGHPTLVLDVAHNPHAVAALAANLEAMGQFPTTHAVFGAMADKDLATMLVTINPLIDRWYFTDLPTPRAESSAHLLEQWQALSNKPDVAAAGYRDPRQALQAAIAAVGPADRIVVFGSFHTVGGVLKDGVPRLHAQFLSDI